MHRPADPKEKELKELRKEVAEQRAELKELRAEVRQQAQTRTATDHTPMSARRPSSIASPCSTAVVTPAKIPGLALEKSKVQAEEVTLSRLRGEIAATESRIKQEREKSVALKLELAAVNTRGEQIARRLALAKEMRNTTVSV